MKVRRVWGPQHVQRKSMGITGAVAVGAGRCKAMGWVLPVCGNEQCNPARGEGNCNKRWGGVVELNNAGKVVNQWATVNW